MIKRPLLLMSLAFAAGIYSFMAEIGFFYLLIVAIAFLAAGLILIKNKKWVCVAIVLFFFLGMGRMSLGQYRRFATAAKFSGTTVEREMTVTQFSKDGKVIVSFEDDGKEYKAHLSTDEEIQLYPGDIISGRFSFKDPYYSKVNMTDFSVYLCSKDVYIYADAEFMTVTGKESSGVDAVIYSVRRYMDEIGAQHFSGDSRALFNAMVFGDERLISDKLDKGLRASGLSHIAVVSGMHISVIIAAMNFFLQKIFGKRRHAYIFAVIGALFVTAVTGAGSSVVRALVMCGVYQFSRVTYRENDIYTTIASSALIMLIFNPFFLFDAGFVLSVLSVLGIVMFSKKIIGAFGWFLSKSAAEAAGVSAAAQIAVTPALVSYFGSFTPYALISNILVALLSTVYVVVGMVLFLVAKIPVISNIISFLLQLMADITEGICYAVSYVPGAVLQTGEIKGFFILLWIFAMILIFKYPLKLRKINFACCIMALLLSVTAFSVETVKMEASFSRYGGRTMTLLKLNNGKSVMADCPDFFDALDYEESAHTDIVCMIMASDYMGTMEEFIKKSPPKVIIASENLLDSYERKKVLSFAKEKNVRVLFLKKGQKIAVEGVSVEYIEIGTTAKIVPKLEYDGCSIVLLQGLLQKDAAAVLNQSRKIECDYLHLPYIFNGKNTDFSKLTDGIVVENQKKLSLR